MSRLAGPFIICVLALANNQANAQAGATPPPASQQEAVQHPASSNEQPASAPSGASEVCRTLEQAAAENGLPVEFFARVIWQESRFNATAVSAEGAEGIAQFMPQTAGWRGLADPFNPIEALRHSASYLHDLMVQFGNLGLAAAGSKLGLPARVGCRPRRAITSPLSPVGPRTSGHHIRHRKQPTRQSPQVCPVLGLPISFWVRKRKRSESHLTFPAGASRLQPICWKARRGQCTVRDRSDTPR